MAIGPWEPSSTWWNAWRLVSSKCREAWLEVTSSWRWKKSYKSVVQFMHLFLYTVWRIAESCPRVCHRTFNYILDVFYSSLISTPWETASREAVEESKEKERESSNHKACVKHIRAHFNLPLCSVFCCCKFAFVIRPLLGFTSWILLYNFEGVWLSSKATRGVSWLSYERRPAYTHWLSHAFRGCLRNCLQLRSKPIIHNNIAKGTRELIVECLGKENRLDICI